MSLYTATSKSSILPSLCIARTKTCGVQGRRDAAGQRRGRSGHRCRQGDSRDRQQATRLRQGVQAERPHSKWTPGGGMRAAQRSQRARRARRAHLAVREDGALQHAQALLRGPRALVLRGSAPAPSQAAMPSKAAGSASHRSAHAPCTPASPPRRRCSAPASPMRNRQEPPPPAVDPRQQPTTAPLRPCPHLADARHEHIVLEGVGEAVGVVVKLLRRGAWAGAGGRWAQTACRADAASQPSTGGCTDSQPAPPSGPPHTLSTFSVRLAPLRSRHSYSCHCATGSGTTCSLPCGGVQRGGRGGRVVAGEGRATAGARLCRWRLAWPGPGPTAGALPCTSGKASAARPTNSSPQPSPAGRSLCATARRGTSTCRR